MASEFGNIFSDYRINPITNAEVPEAITDNDGEQQTVTELSPANVGFYGFELNECPETNGIISVTRVSDSQAFTPSTGAPTTNEYFIDYTNQSPLIIFNSSEDGEAFWIKYNAIGAPMSVKRTLALAAYNRSVASKIQAASEKDITPGATLSLSAKIAQYRNITITANRTIDSNVTDSFAILEIFGDLTINSGVTLTLGRVLLIVHGNITGTGTLSGKVGANGGNGFTLVAGGGGSGGGCINIFCFGEIASGLTIVTGKGGAAGLSSQLTPTAGANAYIDFGGLGGAITTQGGSGGGGIGNGGDEAPTGASNGNNGSGFGSGGSGAAGLGYTRGLGTAGNVWINTGGNGGEYSGGGVLTAPQGGRTGDLNLWSRYTTAPCTVDVSAISGGFAGAENYYDFSDVTDAKYILQEDFNYYVKGTSSGSLPYLPISEVESGSDANGNWNRIQTLLINRGTKDFVFAGAGVTTHTITLPEAYNATTDYVIQISIYDPSLIVANPQTIMAITASTFDVRINSGGAGTVTVHWTTTGDLV